MDRGVIGPSEVDEQVEVILEALVLDPEVCTVDGTGVSKALPLDRGEASSLPSRAGDSASGVGFLLEGVNGDCNSRGRRSASGTIRPCWSSQLVKVSGGGGTRVVLLPVVRSACGVAGMVGDGGESRVPNEDSLDVGL